MAAVTSTLLYLSGDDVAAVAPSMSAVVDAVEEAFRLRGLGRTEMPAKPSLHFGSGAF
jgi:ornithine cyclodeaminase/alanine dehydrogenase-like protein (mu-crystallin family)